MPWTTFQVAVFDHLSSVIHHSFSSYLVQSSFSYHFEYCFLLFLRPCTQLVLSSFPYCFADFFLLFHSNIFLLFFSTFHNFSSFIHCSIVTLDAYSSLWFHYCILIPSCVFAVIFYFWSCLSYLQLYVIRFPFSIFSINDKYKFLTMKHFYPIFQYFIFSCFIFHLRQISCARMPEISRYWVLTYVDVIVANRDNHLSSRISSYLFHIVCSKSHSPSLKLSSCCS